MITVDFHDTQEKDKIFGSRNDYDDDKLITVKALTKGYTDNWGDEDCRKMVTLLTDCDIIIHPLIAHDFDTTTEINFVRYDYYKPAYAIDHDTKTVKEIKNDGTLIFHVRKI